MFFRNCVFWSLRKPLIMKKKFQLGFFTLCVCLCFTSCDFTETDLNDSETVAFADSEEDPYFIFLSDIHLNAHDSTGRTVLGKDDTKIKLWDLAKEKLQGILLSDNPPSFIVYTGDLPGHHPDSGEEHNQNMQAVLQDLEDLAGDIPLFYAPGNNDAMGGDYHSFQNKNDSIPFELLKQSSEYPALNATIYSHDKVHGYYAASPFKGLRVIGLNSVLLCEHDFTDDHCSGHTVETCSEEKREMEGDKEMAWLTSQLAEAKEQGEKVYIIMHVPPGVNVYGGVGNMWRYEKWVASFLKDAHDYESIIAGMMYGHTHMDEVRRMPDGTSPSGFSGVAICCPGITPLHSNNPGFKTVTYNETMDLTDFTTHYTTIGKNKYFGIDGKWGDQHYSFSEAFGCKGTTIKDALTTMHDEEIADSMKNIYFVKASVAPSCIVNGIDVHWVDSLRYTDCLK